ncbi:hypothetical protein TMatcc_002704 [Talaromyces marneffei ATCC 18224]
MWAVSLCSMLLLQLLPVHVLEIGFGRSFAAVAEPWNPQPNIVAIASGAENTSYYSLKLRASRSND